MREYEGMRDVSALFVSQFLPPPDASHQTGGTISNRNFLRCVSRVHGLTALTFDPDAEPAAFAAEPYRVVQRQPPPWRASGLFLHWQAFVRRNTSELITSMGSPSFLIATTSKLAAFDVAPQHTKCLAIVQAFENFGLRCHWVPRRTKIDLMKGAVLRRFQDTRLMRRADAILTNSDFMRSTIVDRFGIDTARIHVLKQQVDIEPATSRPPENTIGFVHRGPDKNIALVLELAARAPDLTFLIYGHSQGLPVATPKNVMMMGWAFDRSAMFASASLWIVPSLWAEPFGRVSIESQAADRPVLVANRGGLPETVFDDRYVLDDFYPDAWLRRIRHLMRIPESEVSASGKSIRTAFSKVAHDQAITKALEMISGSKRTMS